jgi:hypothetical protein
VDRDLVGWIALLQVARIPIDETEHFDTQLRSWETRFSGHPAAAQAGRLATARNARTVPSAIALLIPESGRYATPGRQIRSGFLAAHNQTIEPRPRVRLYDTGEGGAALGLSRATAEGAALVVGPLVKEEVETVARMDGRRVPLLALNRTRDRAVAGAPLYQFGLAPEDEAAQIANDTLRAGARRALAMYPEGEWGERVYGAFRSAFKAGGGTVVDVAIYDPQQADFSAEIMRLFLMDAAEARRSRLQGLLSRNLELQARRRDDADFLMLAAFEAPARQLYPQLRFYRVGDLPVLATSHVYAGDPSPQRDTDLSGLRFLDLPFLLDLDDAQRQAWTAAAGAESDLRPTRLFALGADAYNLAPWLEALASSPGSQIEGLTGGLRIDGEGHLVRTLRWAEFRHGVPAVLPGSPLERL